MGAGFVGTARTVLFLLLGVYTACLLWLLPRLPLTLDEILDLLTLRSGGWNAVLAAVPRNAGGVPLSYLTRWGAILLLGESSFTARLPSALFSAASCVGVFFLARRLGLRWPLLATGLFAAFPLQVRYALEARAYSLALC